jgi:flagellar biosynthetic protein FliQ
MNPAFVQGIGIEAIKVILLVSMPSLLVALVVGLVISVIQATTQIQEATLAYIPKMISIYLVLILFGGYTLERLMNFSISIFSDFSRFVR